ncbi:MAG: GNAT family N-acetyltransferase [Gammaproteobacteria bacterium]|nr:GNAT family N-acetyltransferase [Gammaproteobacteria bacterium]
MRISVHDSLDAIDPAAWNALAGADPFLSHAFLHGLERHDCLAPHGWYPCHLVAWDAERPCAALPLYVRDNSYGEFVFDWSWAEAYERAGGRYYPKLVTAVPFTPVSGPRLLTAPGHEAAAQALLGRVRELAAELECSSWHALFPEESALPEFDGPELMRRQGCQYHWFDHGYGDFDGFLGSLNSKRRKEIKRERREIAAGALTIEVLRGAEITPAHWRIFHRFYCLTFARKWGSPRLTLPFLETLNDGLPDVPVLFLARDGAEYVAGAFALHGKDTLYGRHWGCTRQVRQLHFELCYYQTIDYCLRNGLSHLDAGAQGEHKIPRGFEPIKTWSVHWIRDPRLRAAVRQFLAREATVVDRFVEDLGQHTAFRRDPDHAAPSTEHQDVDE